MPDELLTAAEACERFGFHRSTFARWVSKGYLVPADGAKHDRFRPTRYRAGEIAKLASQLHPNRSDPERDRAVVEAVTEIAERYGYSVATLPSVLHRHRVRLRSGS